MVKIDEIREFFYSYVSEDAVKCGFKKDKFAGGGGLHKKEQNVHQSIGWGIGDYGEIKVFHGFFSLIAFPEIDKIFIPLCNRHKIRNWNYKDNQIREGNFNPPDKSRGPDFLDSDGEKIEFRSLKEIKYIGPLYHEFFIQTLSYFNNWNSLLKVFDYIKDINDNEKLELTGLSQFEKAIIMRLCNDDRCFAYFNDYYEERKMYFEKYIDIEFNARYYNAAKDLKELLPNIKPIYNV
ncbi:MAG: hypothetical protein HYZ42_03265 [Bacteroidetes bacterium]|nr:hypothetical protein [Bacteroidota bacterium]